MQRIAIGLTLTIAAAMSANALAADGWATIKGKVVWSGGDVPTQPALTVTKDQEWCQVARGNKGLGAIPDETLVVNADNKAIKNLFVYMDSRKAPAIHPDYPQDSKAVTAADAKKFEETFGVVPDELQDAVMSGKVKLQDLAKVKTPADSPVVIDQLYCQYVPHAIAIREGQLVTVLNAEPVAHNVKVSSFGGNESNLNMPPGTFLHYNWISERVPLSIECSIHGWMKMYAMVFKHPYFDVTGDEGEFELKNVPAGEIELVIRSPKYILGGPSNKYTLTVKDGDVVELLVQYDGTKGTAEKK